jgi:hypothetical protein
MPGVRPRENCMQVDENISYFMGKGYINQPTTNDRIRKLPRRYRKYFARSPASSLAIKAKTRETRMLNISIRVK